MIRRRPDSPTSIGLIAGALAVVFVVLRLLVAADGDVSRFVVAGQGTTSTEVHPKIYVFDSYGYDGQIYWRLATNPTELHLEAYHGARLDSPNRVSRIGYPTIAWALSFGQTAWVKWSLVLTNVLGMGALAFAGAHLARKYGRPAYVGLAVASSSGLVMALSRDLCEVIMVAGLTAGAALMARERYSWAAACWAVACLTHEQALLVAIPYAAYRLVQLIRERSWKLAAADLPWIVAGTAFAAWQIAARSVIGSFPVQESGNESLGVPFRGLIQQARIWMQDGLERQQLLVIPQLALLAVLVVVAFRSAVSLATEDRWMRWALIGATALAASLSQKVWVGPAELRQFVVLSTLAWFVIVAARRQIPMLLFAATAAVWFATAALRVAAI